MIDIATFRYLDSLGVVQKQDFDVLSIKGMDRVGKFKLIPSQVFGIVDGSKRTEYRGFKRIISVELTPINADEDFVRAFLQASAKSIAYQGLCLASEESQVVFEESEIEGEQIDGFKYEKQFKFELTESAIRHEWYVPVPFEDNMTGFIVHDVEVVGTSGSPEAFETNVGKLQYQHGATVFPPISLLANKVAIVFDYDQAWAFNRVGEVTQSGNNIKFYLALSGSGETAPGTAITKATFMILLQDITL